MRKDQSYYRKDEEDQLFLFEVEQKLIKLQPEEKMSNECNISKIYNDFNSETTMIENSLQIDLNEKKYIRQQQKLDIDMIIKKLQISSILPKQLFVELLMKMDKESFSQNFEKLKLISIKKEILSPMIIYLTTNDEIHKLTNLMLELDPLLFRDYEESLIQIADYFSSAYIEKIESSNYPERIEILFNVIISSICKGTMKLSWIPSLNLTIKDLAKKNQLNQALSLINYLIYCQIEIYTPAINFLLEELGRSMIIDELIKLFEKLLYFNPKIAFSEKNKVILSRIVLNSGVDYSTFFVVIKTLCRTNNLQIAKNYYFLVKSNKMINNDSIFNIFIECCSKNEKLEELRFFYYEMLSINIKPSLLTFNLTIEAFIKSRQFEDAWKVYNDMTKYSQEPDTFTYTTLFKSVKDSVLINYLEKAINILEIIIETKQKPEIILINVLLDSCFALKEINLADTIFKKVNNKYYNITPDIITFNTYIKGCAQSIQYEKAFEAFKLIPIVTSPNDVTINTMIDICVRAGDNEKKKYFINLLGEYEIKPDNFTYSTIIKGMNNKNNSLSEAFQLFDIAKKYNRADEILYNCIMDACLRFGDIDRMLIVFEEMKKNGIKPSTITYGIAIKAFGMNGNLTKSIDIYQQMRRDKIEVSAVTYGCLINACIKNDNLQKAFDLYEELNNEGIGLNTILNTTLIKAYSKAKNISKVLEIFERMKKEKSNLPNNVTYNSVIDCCVRNDQMHLAEMIISELYNHHLLKPDIIAFSTLIKGYIKQKDLSKPIQLLKIMEKFNIKPDEVLLNSLLDGCDKMKNYRTGVDIFIHVRKYIYPSLMSFSIMMKIYGKLNNYQDSRKLIDELRNNQDNISVIIYTCYIRTCFNSKKIEEAMEVYKEIKSKKLCPDEVTFNTLLIGFSNNKCVEYTYEILKASIESKKVLKFHLYEKCISIIATSYNEEVIIDIINKLRYFDIRIDVKKYVKNYQFIPKTKEATKNFGFDYLLENYKYKTDDKNDENINNLDKNQLKIIGNLTEKTFHNECINQDTFKELGNKDDSFMNKESKIIKKFNKEFKKPFNIVFTANTQPITNGFERGTKLSSVKQSSNASNIISRNENNKKIEKSFKINRF